MCVSCTRIEVNFAQDLIDIEYSAAIYSFVDRFRICATLIISEQHELSTVNKNNFQLAAFFWPFVITQPILAEVMSSVVLIPKFPNNTIPIQFFLPKIQYPYNTLLRYYFST